jgi:O-antigen/teichoic acid export membrane protein
LTQPSDSSKARGVSSTIKLSVFSLVTTIIGLATTVIVARHYPTQDYGVFVLILVLVSFVDQISTLGLEMSIPKFIAGAKDELTKEQFFSTGVIVRIGAILLASLLAWLGSPLLMAVFGQSLLPGFILYVPLLFALDSFQSFLQSVLQGSFLFTTMGITSLISSVTYLMLLLWVVYGINGSIALLLLAKAVSSLVVCVILLFSIPIKKRLSFRIDIFKDLMKFGLPLQINDILSFIFSRIDTIVVAAFLGPADIALYEIARKVPDNLRSFYGPFIQVYFPFISKRYVLEGRQQASDLLNDALRFVAFVTLFGAAIAVLFGRAIIELLFSSKYVSVAPVFVLLMVNLSVALISNVMGNTIVGVGDSDKPMFINSFNAVASWLASLLLIPVYALFGAAAANTIGTLVAYPLNRYFLRRRIQLKDLAYLKPIFLFIAWLLPVLVLRPDSFLVKVGFLLVFLLASILLSIITKDDMARLIEGSGLNNWHLFKKLGIWFSKP